MVPAEAVHRIKDFYVHGDTYVSVVYGMIS
jgi:hypothetical protein